MIMLKKLLEKLVLEHPLKLMVLIVIVWVGIVWVVKKMGF